ncbi:uncharacterized protein LOC124445925 [Xenia sp. Carnegie-2017]|uniref:uncharacterized protein LOC124445925 n=1 Tax=Xenia sp. Carnegie-2017 TaxID=2897299 RepID=UPI001F0456D5|nr:uncharacterized protein LOC124445925 [Xenia sp. Carnegie-2017]
MLLRICTQSCYSKGYCTLFGVATGSKPYEDKLLDVVWDVHKGKIRRMNCHFDRYEIWDLVKIDDSQLKTREERKDHMEEDIYDDAFDEDAEASRNDPSQVGRKQRSNGELNDAAIVLQRAIKRWMSQKALTEKQEVENDPVKFYFQKFKLGKSSCTICRPVEFVDLSSTIKSSEELQIEDKEQGWTPRLLKRNTFNTHCGRKSPHWKTEKSFVNYVEFYRKQVYPIKRKAETLIENMGNLGDKYYLDLDRLKDLMNQLNEKMKKVENDRRWDSISLVRKAAEEVDKATYKMNDMTKRRGSLNPSERVLEEEFKDVFEEDEQLVGQLKPVHNIKAKKKEYEKRKR